MEPQIQRAIAVMLNAIDGLEWEIVRASFTSTIAVDYTSVFGGSPERLPVDALLDRWRALLPGFDATQHLIGPLIVSPTNTGATLVVGQARGYHYISGATGGEVWIAAGQYRLTMAQHAGEWRISGITFRLAYQEGNLGLPAIAQSRASAGIRRR